MNELKKIFNLSEYQEKIINLEKKEVDIKELGIEICSKELYDEFIFYEKEEEISIGIGIELLVEVYSGKIIIKNNQQQVEKSIKDLSTDIKSLFLDLGIKNWRAYGVSDFNFSYYSYSTETLGNNELMMKFIIPKIDLRLDSKALKIKVMKTKNILRVINIVEEYKKQDLEEIKWQNNSLKLKEQNSDEYKSIVSEAISEIKEKKYQKVILSRKICLNKRIDMGKSYLVGRSKNTPARSYYIKLKDLEVIGYSPETIVEVDSEKNVYTFPLAGTRAIGRDEIEKATLKEELVTDPKEIAEHAVSVKLAFEELEKVCDVGSISVIQFMEVLERGTVQHLASRLKGKLKNDKNEWDAFAALFPAVTASGIPKKESLDAINRLEKDKRELYSGGVFTYDEDGSLDIALVLRSAYQNKEMSWVRAGAGIVSLSKPERELEETKEKLSSVINQLVYLDK